MAAIKDPAENLKPLGVWLDCIAGFSVLSRTLLRGFGLVRRQRQLYDVGVAGLRPHWAERLKPLLLGVQEVERLLVDLHRNCISFVVSHLVLSAPLK